MSDTARVQCNKYIEENKRIKKLFDNLNEDDGIMLQSHFEDFAKSYALQVAREAVEDVRKDQEFEPNDSYKMGLLDGISGVKTRIESKLEEQS